MASTYTRKDSPFIHIRFKDESGKWRGQPTSYRKGHKKEIEKAEKLAYELSQDERARRPIEPGGAFRKWVAPWMQTRYGKSERTLKVYGRHWKKLDQWLHAHDLKHPAHLLYRHGLEYREARILAGASNNTVLHELKFLGVVMQEAVRREYASANPFTRMGIKKDKPKEKNPWTDEEIASVGRAIASQSHFLRASFLLGLYQAARLRQCAVPLSDIHVAGMRITYRQTKGDKPFTQPLDPRIIAPLEQLIQERIAIGAKTLCDIPVLPSVEWRRFLDSLGLYHLVHHGLRVTWITRAALSRGAVSQPEAKRFVNHGSSSIHALYQKLNADDVAHVPAAMNLPTLTGHPAQQPKQGSAPSSSGEEADT